MFAYIASMCMGESAQTRGLQLWAQAESGHPARPSPLDTIYLFLS
jgi:hypothetical protein